jgi:hypothetical protein
MMTCRRQVSIIQLLGALALASTVATLPASALAADVAPGEEVRREPAAEHTLAATPSGVDSNTAMVGERGVGAAGVGELDVISKVDALGGMRLWASFLNRLVVQGDAFKGENGRFRPSLAVVGRVLGDRRRGWAMGLMGRYRTEGLTTVEGEIEGGVVGSFAREGLHLDLGLAAGAGLEEEEKDAEGQLRFGYDIWRALRLGFEGRVRRELEEEAEETGGERGAGGEWDMFGGAQASVAVDHFFGVLTVGPLKRRTSEDVDLMLHLIVGGVAF